MSTRWTITLIRRNYPSWVSERERQQHEARLRNAASDKPWPPIVFKLLEAIHLPALPEPQEAVAWAVQLACGHEQPFINKTDDPPPKWEGIRLHCPEYDCTSAHRTISKWLEPGEPKPHFLHTDFGMKRYRATRLCNCRETKAVWVRPGEPRSGGEGKGYPCWTCCPDGADNRTFGYEAELHEQLPDEMVCDWKVKLDCGHEDVVHELPVEVTDPATYHAESENSPQKCFDQKCRPPAIVGIRKLGRVTSPRKEKPKASPARKTDPVATTAATAAALKRRLSPAERKALIAQLQEDT